MLVSRVVSLASQSNETVKVLNDSMYPLLSLSHLATDHAQWCVLSTWRIGKIFVCQLCGQVVA